MLYAFDGVVFIVNTDHLSFFSTVVVEYNLFYLLAFVSQVAFDYVGNHLLADVHFQLVKTVFWSASPGLA